MHVTIYNTFEFVDDQTCFHWQGWALVPSGCLQLGWAWFCHLSRSLATYSQFTNSFQLFLLPFFQHTIWTATRVNDISCFWIFPASLKTPSTLRMPNFHSALENPQAGLCNGGTQKQVVQPWDGHQSVNNWTVLQEATYLSSVVQFIQISLLVVLAPSDLNILIISVWTSWSYSLILFNADPPIYPSINPPTPSSILYCCKIKICGSIHVYMYHADCMALPAH